MKRLSILISLFPLVAAASPDPIRPVDETMIRPRNLESATATTGRASGTITVEYAIRFSNSCFAETEMEPLTLRQTVADGRGQQHHHLLFVVQSKANRICPQIFDPVTVRYRTEVAHLQAGETYDVQILGLPGADSAYTSLQVTAAK